MSGRISNPIRWLAVITTLLVSGICVGLRANTARANAPIEDCLNAPKSPAPQGSHWYYRVDRVKLRKCWYLGALDQPVHHAAVQSLPRAAPATHPIALEKPAPASAAAPVSITSDDSAPPLPHIKMLAVKPQPTPVMSGGTTDQLTQQSAQEGDTGRSIPEIPAAQSSTSSQTSAQAAGPAPDAATVRPDLSTVAPVKAQDPVVLNDSRTSSVQPIPDPADPESTARIGALTNTAAIAHPSVEMFSVLALWLTIVVIAFGIVMKIATARRRRIIIDRREFNWIGDRHQYEWCGEQQRQGCVAELGEFIDDVRRQIIPAARNYSPHPLPQADDEWPDHSAKDVASQSTEEISECQDTLAQLKRDLDELLRPCKVA